MPNNYLSVLYKHIIQVENNNVGLKVGEGAQTYHCLPPPPNQKVGDTCPLAPPPPPLSPPPSNVNQSLLTFYKQPIGPT